MASVTKLLQDVNDGNQSARDELMAIVYDELRRLADFYLQHERPNHTLQPTALVHEAYLRLVGQDAVRWQSREHFVAIAATMMRRVLVDYARTRKRDKRGGGDYKISLSEADRQAKSEGVDLILLDDALKKLAARYPLKSQVVELRFFGGLTIEETARVLNASDSTVERDWKFARAWLLREMGGE
jgi:RNA polymerase sigma-70 factor, ECF subfamily